MQVLVEYKNKESNHVEWAKALKELYSPGLRDYVKRFYPLGPEWGQPGSANVSARQSTTTAAQVPAEKTQSAPSQPKAGMSAVFQEISSGKSVTAGADANFLPPKLDTMFLTYALGVITMLNHALQVSER